MNKFLFFNRISVALVQLLRDAQCEKCGYKLYRAIFLCIFKGIILCKNVGFIKRLPSIVLMDMQILSRSGTRSADPANPMIDRS